MRISDWSSDCCSSDLPQAALITYCSVARPSSPSKRPKNCISWTTSSARASTGDASSSACLAAASNGATCAMPLTSVASSSRSEEHTSELQSLMRISYAVFCLKKKINLTHPCLLHKVHISRTSEDQAHNLTHKRD